MKAGDFGSQAEYHFDFEALRNLPLFGKYYLQIGVDYERFAFSRSNDIFPYAMSSVSAEIAISYWTGDVFFPLLKLEPGIYFTRDYMRALRQTGFRFCSVTNLLASRLSSKTFSHLHLQT
jgi:hypothetical protein